MLHSPSGDSRVDVLVRFFPGEWLPNLSRRAQWAPFFRGADTRLSNPATALVTQSKRFPLVWDRLQTPLPTWRALLPETCHPRRVRWQRDDRWVLKPALGRVGDAIGLRSVIPGREWSLIARDATWRPGDWVAQRRFDLVPLAGPAGPVYSVIGVYTVDRRVAGIYGRLASRPLIDHRAQDVAVLVPLPIDHVHAAPDGSQAAAQQPGR
jgi:glutathionylspermidine synthase